MAVLADLLRARARLLLPIAAGLAAMLVSNSPAAAHHPSCVVASVVDGDTFDCADGTRVRMLYIDAPELDECGGAWARDALAGIFLRPGTAVRLAYASATPDAGDAHVAAPVVTGTDGHEYNISTVMVYVGLARAAYSGARTTRIDGIFAVEAWARYAQWNMWAPGGPFNGAAACG